MVAQYSVDYCLYRVSWGWKLIQISLGQIIGSHMHDLDHDIFHGKSTPDLM